MSAVEPGGRILVTGSNGFVGRHATRLLEAEGFEVVPVSGQDTDLTQGWPDVRGVDGILHLAGLAAVGASFDDPQRYVDVNSAMMTRLGERLLATAHGHVPRVVVVSTGGVYGSSSQPLTEDSGFAFTSPYVVSKVLVENLAEYYRNRGLDLVVARPFNHIGPGQGAGFLIPDLTARLRALEPDAALRVGNLATSRDYTDVRDVIRAYRSLLVAPVLHHSVYNIASGRSRTGREVLGVLCSILGIAVPPVAQEARRGLDPSSVLADASRIRRETGWTPDIPFERSVADFLAEG